MLAGELQSTQGEVDRDDVLTAGRQQAGEHADRTADLQTETVGALRQGRQGRRVLLALIVARAIAPGGGALVIEPLEALDCCCRRHGCSVSSISVPSLVILGSSRCWSRNRSRSRRARSSVLAPISARDPQTRAAAPEISSAHSYSATRHSRASTAVSTPGRGSSSWSSSVVVCCSQRSIVPWATRIRRRPW